MIQPTVPRVDLSSTPKSIAVHPMVNSSLFNGQQTREVKEFITWLLDEYLRVGHAQSSPRQILVYVDGRVNKKGFNGFIQNRGDKGYSIFINLGNLKDIKKALKTISHELIHAKQYACGDLLIGADRWQGTHHTPNVEHLFTEQQLKDGGKKYLAYISQPWEQEAFFNAPIMLDLWVERLESLGRKSSILR